MENNELSSNLLEKDSVKEEEEGKENSHEKKRDKWGSNYEYILSALGKSIIKLGLAAGYGSIWRFPYLIWKNGFFLLSYIVEEHF